MVAVVSLSVALLERALRCEHDENGEANPNPRKYHTMGNDGADANDFYKLFACMNGPKYLRALK